MISKNLPARIILSAICLLAPASALAQCTTTNFHATINVEAGTSPQDMAAGDFNSDGRTDLVVTNFNNEVYILLGTSAGGPTVTKLTSVNKARGVGVGDFNKDEKPDLAINHENPDGTDAISILLGNGSSVFGAPNDFPTTNEGTLLVADFNNDTNPDVFVGSRSGGTSQLLLGNGTGGLSGAVSKSVVLTENGVVADFNKDGKLDLAIANDGPFIAVYLGDGAGNFGAIETFPVNRAKFLVTADFNGDNNLDVVTAGQLTGISILLGDGAGNFGTATTINLSFTATMIVTADFNEDGKPDVVVDSGESRIFFMLRGNGNGTFAPPHGYRTNSSPRDMLTGEFNGDGNVDIASLNAGGSVILAPGDGVGNLRTAGDVPVGFNPFAIASGDLNNDGDDDVIVTNITHHTVEVLVSNGSGGFGSPTPFPVQTGPISIAIGDLNEDQKLDVVIANFNSGTVSVLLGNGQGGLGPANNIAVPGTGPTEVAIADINTDGKPDLAVGYLNTNSLSILPGNGTGGFGPPNNFPVPSATQDIAVGDVNRDGLPDLAVATNTGVAVLIGNVALGFAPAIILPPAGNSSVVIRDFNGDGKADIAAAQQNQSVVNVYLGDGQTNFTQPTPFKASAPIDLNAADFNGDGNVDLVTTNSLGLTSVLLGNGTGGFADAVNYHATHITATRSLTTGDFNSDGHPDIAVTDFEGIISIILNTCSATPVSAPTISIGNATVTEGDSGNTNATFNVNLSAASTKTVVVSFYTAARDTTKDADYATRVGALIFTPGVTSQTITVPVIGDGFKELDEVFVVNLTNALNATIADTQGIGVIVNDDHLQMFVDESGPAANQAAALDAILFLRDPFRRTRVMVFAENLNTNATNVVIALKGADNQTYEIQPEDVRLVPDQEFAQIVFALPESLASGVCTVTIKAQGKVSNTTTIRIAP